MSNRRKTGLRAALAKKKIRIEHYDVPLVDHEEAVTKAKEYRDKRATADLAAFGEDKDAYREAEDAAGRAKKVLEECFYRVEFRGLSEPDFEALVNAHPPTDEQVKAGEIWNPDTFLYALIEHCILDGDGMTADDWREELSNAERWPRPDRAAFLNAVLGANQRSFSEGIPKD